MFKHCKVKSFYVFTFRGGDKRTIFLLGGLKVCYSHLHDVLIIIQTLYLTSKLLICRRHNIIHSGITIRAWAKYYMSLNCNTDGWGLLNWSDYIIHAYIFHIIAL